MSPFACVAAADVPWLSAAEMRVIDDIAVGELGLDLLQMMENAGRSLAAVTLHQLGGSVAGMRVVVLAGPGGNGGGGLAAARHLVAAGASPDVRLASAPTMLKAATRHQLTILERIGAQIQVGAGAGLGDPDVVLDALLGYSQSGAPRGDAAALIEAANGLRVLALDVPSGLELASGTLFEPHIVAEATVTLAAPKLGLRGRAAGTAAGTLYLADIAIPPLAFERIGRSHASPFSRGPIVRLV